MAGLTELSWKRSYDLSLKNSFQIPRAPQAWRDHLHRRFPDKMREVLAVETLDEVTAVLARSRTRDATYIYLKKHPE